MKSLCAIFIVIATSFANAYQPGTYSCTTGAGWDKYDVTIIEVALSAKIKVPYAVYTGASKQVSGIATVTKDKTAETLSIGEIQLVSFAADKITDDCQKKN